MSASDDDLTGTELVVVAASLAFTVALFTYVVSQALLGTPAAAPDARVLDVEPLENGDVRVRVAVRNPRQSGLASATVEVACTVPPTELTFAHVPVEGQRIGYVVCPPGTANPNATVVSWIES